MNKQADVIIVGSGLAALQLAHHLHSTSHVIILTKTKIRQSNSYIAQGGIAAVIDKDDSVHSHVEDTLKAGRYHHFTEEVERLAGEGAAAVKELIAGGLGIDREADGQPSLGLEGAHSAKRIVHSGGDATGRHTVEHLLATLPANVEIIEGEMAYECLLSEDRSVCIGVKTKNKEGQIHHYWSSHVVLATGGIGAIYPATSNQPTMTGDGIAMAFRAGAEVTDMEFVQFHPTLLFKDGAARGLISEAVRGAGGVLVDENGVSLMEGVHPLRDLAPRHVTAYEIYKALARGTAVFLDIRRVQQFEKQFPTITALCKRNGVPISKGFLPVAPGSHFLMGGISVDSNGCTTVPGLYAVGEAAHSGVHGANRLASNSLLEGIVYGRRLAAFLNRHIPVKSRPADMFYYEKQLKSESAITLSKEELRARTMKAAGIIRTSECLQNHVSYLEKLGIQKWIESGLDELDRDAIEKIDMHINSYLISRAALLRQESRGAHIRTDFPVEEVDWCGKRIVQTKDQINIRGGQHERNPIRIHA
ncbi:L-aspartate oxidase [Pseudobacillus wudalianchiensis]|uniref:L-aspartate oxidase n=1 Tax=Pseudobacillus wudalianchiensis TaxID=1743143 RepID=A0A1B9B8L4_9BACI|nr:L-aspartate oxidase [Bacillus wudalianchiensis]OCA92420.1 L-aspartate oxidase [Bacillus wudalianchiensis]